MARTHATLRRLTTLLALAAMMLVQGCVVTDELFIELSFGTATTGCLGGGVSSIDYDLFDVRGNLIESRTNVACRDLSFGNLLSDTYELDVYGYDNTGFEVYAGTCVDLFYNGIDDATYRCTIPFSGDPLRVDVDWDLDQTSGFVGGNCASAGVVDYDYTLTDGSGNVLFNETQIACTGTGALTIDLGIQPTGTYGLEITGYDTNANDFWYAFCSVSPLASGNSFCQVRDDP